MYRAGGEAECSMKLHPTCALERITMVQFLLLSCNYAIWACIVLVTMVNSATNVAGSY